MEMELRPYPAYKPSGVEWLGDVPAHWEVPRLRNLVEMRVSNVDKHVKDGELPVRLCNYVDVYKNDRITENIAFMRATATASEIERFRLEAGDVLITKDSETWNDIGVPALVEHTADDLVCGYHLAVLRPLQTALHGAYLFRALQSPTVNYQFHIAANGVTRYGLTHEAIKSVRLPLPPLAEQTAIVRYLDYMDQRIRRYIEIKEKLLPLLQEARQVTIHQAVTRGLDPDVPLKPSGVELLGDVPAHWEVVALKRIGRFTSGTGFPIEDQGHPNEVLPFFKVSDMNLPGNDRVMTTWNNSISYETAEKLRAVIVPPGTIVFPKVGGALLTNKRRVVERPCCIDNNLMGCIVHRGDPDYVLLLPENLDLGMIAKPGPVPSISERDVREIRAVVPPLAEQTAIAAHLDKATADIDAAIDATRRQSELMREYRASLIAHVVTGKLDARAATDHAAARAS